MDLSRNSFLHSFTGREHELSLLKQRLLTAGSEVISITGEYGVGKTSLAMKFAHENTEAFPGGIYHMYALPSKTLSETVNAHTPNSPLPHLLILDETERRSVQEVASEISIIRRERPSAKLLCIGRHTELKKHADFNLELPGLSRSDLFQILSNLKFPLSSDELRELDFLGGNPRVAQVIADSFKNSGIKLDEVRKKMSAFSYSGLLGLDGRPMGAGSLEELQIVSDLRLVSDDLLTRAHANPSLLYEITPRRFEEFVAELLQRLGYDVILTAASNDGGKDMYAAKKDDLGTFLYFVECKRYAPDNPVGVELIRQLNGVVHAEKATAGILATTSYFTRGAKEFQKNVSNQISLKDYIGLQQWMSKVLRN